MIKRVFVATTLIVATLNITSYAGWEYNNNVWNYKDDYTQEYVTDSIVDGYYVDKEGVCKEWDDTSIRCLRYLADVLDGKTGSYMTDISPEEVIDYVRALGLSYSIWYTDSGKVYYPDYMLPKIKSDLEYINTYVQPIVDGAMSLPKSERIRYIHDQLVTRLEYGYVDSKSLVDGLRQNKAVCWGYAALFRVICDKVGILCDYREGTTAQGAHAWNIVHLDGKEYLVDVTWDDTASCYDYFMKEDYNDRVES